MTVPFDENTLTWQTRIEDNDILNEMQEQRIQCPPQLANNVHRIRNKKLLADYLHWAAGYPQKNMDRSN